MEIDEEFFKSQKQFQDAVLENISVTQQSLKAMNERIELLNKRINLADTLIDKLMETLGCSAKNNGA